MKEVEAEPRRHEHHKKTDTEMNFCIQLGLNRIDQSCPRVGHTAPETGLLHSRPSVYLQMFH